MTVQRVQWTCPICNRRYAIPATAPTPSRCPQCRQAAEQEEDVSQSAVASDLFGVRESSERVVEKAIRIAEISPLAAIQLEVTEEASRGPTAAAPVIRSDEPSLEILKTISRLYLGLAGLTLLGGIGGLLYGLWAAVSMEATPARGTVIFIAIAAFGGSLLVALIFYTIREIIRLLLDIEANLR